MLSKKYMKEIIKLANEDPDTKKVNMPEIPELDDSLQSIDDSPKKRSIYRKIMKIINKHGSKHLKKYEANNAPLVRNDIFANDELMNDSSYSFHKHQINLLKRNIARGSKKGKRFCLNFFVGNLYGIMNKQEEANENGTHDFELYMQGGANQAVDDLDYINDVKSNDSYPSPFDLMNDTDAIKNNVALGKVHMRKFNTKEEQKRISKNIDKLQVQAVDNLY